MAMELRGSLNLSKYRTKPTQPRFYGRALINGKEYKIKGWEKTGAEGPWISLLFEEPESEDTFSDPPTLFSNDLQIDDDDVPF